MLQSFLSSVTVRLQGRLVPTHSYYNREGGKRPSPCAANSRYEIEGDRTAERLGLTRDKLSNRDDLTAHPHRYGSQEVNQEE